MNLPKSKLVKRQVKKFSKEYKGRTYHLEIRFDDECGNKHNTFAMTYHVWNRRHTDWEEGGSDPELIAEVWPEYAKYLKWHLCSTDGPMHYLANTIYLAGDRDCWGLRKGEKRQIINGRTKLPSWKLMALDEAGNELELATLNKYQDAAEQPQGGHRLEWRPWCRIGEGKEPDIGGARRCAIWPDATLEQLQDKEALLARLPGLMEEFKAAVEELGFEY